MGGDNRRNDGRDEKEDCTGEQRVRQGNVVKNRDRRSNGQRCVRVRNSDRVYIRGKRRLLDVLGGVMIKIPDTEVVWIPWDLNDHVGEGSLDTEVTGKYGVGARNEGGDRIVDFSIAKSMRVVNTYFQKNRATYASGGQNTQVDYILCRRKELQKVKDCYVLPKEAVAK
ncbi:craniofacial development protein 2-like [Penaeus chinensis]|uniref:craniofacial development protein 2-like n=1 Tax=Penaeus chinensis TaxID=139456 RepID=UPI001FB7449E|nr:craniofacial development protein 2-like [Penaeus chinensis]